ncbi:dUTP diphosphatase [[Mycoplasma] collis]|uniref:dUTP diphosphatase n=1 Tax=[Mycoplasma] collis TaxID=2127 RepID=UPI00051BCB0B|nr:dUTP diphosphatase [[Mycoplasma] collis]
MNFQQIFTFQKELDKKFTKSINSPSEFENWYLKITLAIIVEIAEFANEIQSFKYWKKNKEIKKDKLLEEWVDIIHFLSSLAIDQKLEPIIFKKVVSNDLNFQLSSLFSSAVKLKDEVNKENLLKTFEKVLGFLDLLNITEDELISAYFKKAEINLKRIEAKY